MTQRERLVAQMRTVATGTLKLTLHEAEVFASHVADANEGIHVIGQLCTGPNALQSNTLSVMLERWFRLLPQYDSPLKQLQHRPGQSAVVPNLLESSALMLHSRVFEVCVAERNMAEAPALQVAEHLRQAAPAFFALEQKFRAPERHTQRVLCATLRAALGMPNRHASEAAGVFLSGEA